MTFIKKIIPIVTNRYLLAIVAFVVWMLFMDQRDVFVQMERAKELQKLEEAKSYYNKEIQKTKTQLDNLQTNPRSIEKFARERYLLKREGEEVFVFEDTVAPAPSKAEKH
jgi:cell division protein FtsB